MDDKVYLQKAELGHPQPLEEAVDALFSSLPAAKRITAGTRVLIKPNLLRKNAPEHAVTTHPQVLAAVIKAVRKRGASDIVVADSPGGPYSPSAMRGTYQACGITAACREAGATAYTECQSGQKKTAGVRVKEFTLLRPVLEADFIINLPKMKTHVLTTLSGAVKNLFGCVPGLQKAEFHTRFPQKEDFAHMLVDLCQAVQADIHLVDGILAMEGDGPGSGTPRSCGLLLAAENPYLADLALCHLMGIDPMSTPVLAAAHGRGLCPEALPQGSLVGDDALKQPLEGYVMPRSYTGRVDFSGNFPKFLQPLAARMMGAVAPKLVIQKNRCIGCAKCAEICPQRAIAMPNGKAHINYKECIRCFCCHEMCPAHAIDVRRTGLFRL